MNGEESIQLVSSSYHDWSHPEWKQKLSKVLKVAIISRWWRILLKTVNSASNRGFVTTTVSNALLLTCWVERGEHCNAVFHLIFFLGLFHMKKNSFCEIMMIRMLMRGWLSYGTSWLLIRYVASVRNWKPKNFYYSEKCLSFNQQ